MELTTTYTYNAANQLTTAQESNNPTVWQYTYDNNGSLKEVLPDGLPGDGAQKYKYNTAGYLTQVEKYLGGSYQIQAQMAYNGRGDRLSVTASGVTTTYTLDLVKGGQPLVATAGGADTTYLYGLSAVAEHTDAWSYYLKDGLGTPRQLVDPAGQITLGRDFTPWGEVLGQFGEGNFSFGYLGGLMDAATGLIYMGNGQYYDPATGRLLNPVRNYDSESFQNPYLPQGYADPTLALMAPLALLTLMMGGRKKRGKGDKWIIMLVLALAIGMSLAACGGETGTSEDSSETQPAPTTPPNQGSGTDSEAVNYGNDTGGNYGGSSTFDPTIAALICTATGTLIPDPTQTAEPTTTPTSGSGGGGDGWLDPNVGFQLGVEANVVIVYTEIRDSLYQQHGSKYVDEKGQIRDVALLAFIAKEFGNVPKGDDAYNEAVEALSNRYYEGNKTMQSQWSSEGLSLPPTNWERCAGSCTFEEQLVWMNDYEHFRTWTSAKILANWELMLDAAKAAINGYMHGSSDISWTWGNYWPGSLADKFFNHDGDDEWMNAYRKEHCKNIYCPAYVAVYEPERFWVLAPLQDTLCTNYKPSCKGWK